MTKKGCREEYYMVVPKDIGKKLKIEGRQFPSRSKRVVTSNRKVFFGSILAKKIKIKKRIVCRR